MPSCICIPRCPAQGCRGQEAWYRAGLGENSACGAGLPSAGDNCLALPGAGPLLMPVHLSGAGQDRLGLVWVSGRRAGTLWCRLRRFHVVCRVLPCCVLQRGASRVSSYCWSLSQLCQTAGSGLPGEDLGRTGSRLGAVCLYRAVLVCEGSLW